MWDCHFTDDEANDDPDILAARRRLELLRAGEADIPDLDDYRARRRSTPIPPDAS